MAYEKDSTLRKKCKYKKYAEYIINTGNNRTYLHDKNVIKMTMIIDAV